MSASDLRTVIRSRARGSFRCALFAVVASVEFAIPGAYSDPARTSPMRSIVNGQRLQPTDRELKAIGAPDVSATQAAEVDRLYRQLMHCAASRCGNPNGAPE